MSKSALIANEGSGCGKVRWARLKATQPASRLKIEVWALRDSDGIGKRTEKIKIEEEWKITSNAAVVGWGAFINSVIGNWS